MQFTGHMGRIMGIDWFPNDMGFTTCGQDGNIFFYDLYTSQDIGVRNTDHTFFRRDVKFSSVVNLPGKDYNFIAVGSDKTIHTEANELKTIPR